MSTTVYTAYALDDPAYGPPGITVEDEESRPVLKKDLAWEAGAWSPEQADEILLGESFRRVAPWQWLSPQYVAEVEDVEGETTGERQREEGQQ